VQRVHAAIEQQQARRAHGVDGAQDSADVAGVLRGDGCHQPGGIARAQVVQAETAWPDNSQQPLRVVLAGYAGQHVGRRLIDGHARRRGPRRQTATELANQ